MIETTGDLSGWFLHRIERSFKKHELKGLEETQAYLALMLTKFSSPDHNIDKPLVYIYAEARETVGSGKLEKLSQLGDTALCLAGFFKERLDRQGIGQEYARRMGSLGYRQAADLARPLQARVFTELSGSFDRLIPVLDELREISMPRSPHEIVQLYDRWRRTGSKREADVLRMCGFIIDDDPTLH